MEKLEKLLLVFFFNAETSVDYVELDCVLSFDQDSFHLDFDVAFECELHRVSDQVVEDLDQSPRVGVENFRDLLIDNLLEIDPANLGAFGKAVEETWENLMEIGWFNINRVLVFLVDVFGGII